MRYLVVDGYALAHRAWHAYPELKNNAGRATQVTVGFFRQLLSKVRDLESYQPIFVFDSSGNFRKQLDSNYKANRSAQADSFYQQIDELIHLCGLLAPVYRADGYEADDLAGSFVAQKLGPDDSAVLLTVDGDWLQLLQPNVEVLQLKTVGAPVHWTRELFFERHSGLTPKQLIDVKAICGDDSDNIPGIKGLGWVTVNKLLQSYSTVEGIFENILLIPNKGNVQVKLMENKERILLNKELATIKTDVVLEDQSKGVDTDTFLDYVLETLNAESLANLLGVYIQKRAEAVA